MSCVLSADSQYDLHVHDRFANSNDRFVPVQGTCVFTSWLCKLARCVLLQALSLAKRRGCAMHLPNMLLGSHNVLCCQCVVRLRPFCWLSKVPLQQSINVPLLVQCGGHFDNSPSLYCTERPLNATVAPERVSPRTAVGCNSP